MNIIDIHTHIFPEKIAKKASHAVGVFYDIPMRHDGSVGTALKELDRAGIGRFAAHSVATTPAQVKSINRFILETRDLHPERVIPFAALHPDAEDIPGIVAEAIAGGFKGIKIHPDIQGFQIDSEKSLRMLSEVEGKLPVLIHTGDRRYDFSGPERMIRVLDALPNITVICAHLGGYGQWEDAARLLPGRENVYIDTSSSLYAVPAKRAAEIIRQFGVERTLFGTDYPMWSPEEEVRRLEHLPLTDGEKELIYHKNAERLLGLSEQED